MRLDTMFKAQFTMLERFLASRQLHNFALAPSNQLSTEEDFDQILDQDEEEDATRISFQ